MAQVDPSICPSSSTSTNSTYITESDWWKNSPTPLCGFNAQTQIYTSNLTACCTVDTIQTYNGCFYYCEPMNVDDFGNCVGMNAVSGTSGLGTICNGKTTSGAEGGLVPLSRLTGLWILGLCLWGMVG